MLCKSLKLTQLSDTGFVFQHIVLSSVPRRLEPVGHPLSVHVYFYDDHFQGYLVRQEVRAPGSAARETLEVWAVPQATLILDANLKEFERLKNLEVSVVLVSICR